MKPNNAMTALVVLGRILYSFIFILSGIDQLVRFPMYLEYASTNSVPIPTLAVLGTGLMIVAGGLMVMLGWRARFGAFLLAIFLIPTAFFIHRFWGLEGSATAQNQLSHFLKNMSMAGAALLIVHFGSGPGSLDQRRRERGDG